jgi:hypothetical protein
MRNPAWSDPGGVSVLFELIEVIEIKKIDEEFFK